MEPGQRGGVISVRQPTLLDVARSLTPTEPIDHVHRRRSSPPEPGRCAGCGNPSYIAWCATCVPGLPTGRWPDLAYSSHGQEDAPQVDRRKGTKIPRRA